MFRLLSLLPGLASGLRGPLVESSVPVPGASQFFYESTRALSEASIRRRKKKRKPTTGSTKAASTLVTSGSLGNQAKEERKKNVAVTPLTMPVLERSTFRKAHSTDEPATGLSLTFLGTGSGQPTLERAASSVLLRYRGGSILFEAGEGTQLQLEKSGISPKHIDHIFISHLHGDNVWGLPNIICDIAAYRQSPRGLPHVFGPVGTRRLLDTVFLCSQGRKRNSLCLISELHLPENRATNPLRVEGKRPTERNIIPQNVKNKYWKVAELPYPGSEDPLRVTACRLQHNIPSFGYVFEEPDELVTFHPELAEKLGVPKGLVWNRLESGRTVTFDRQTVKPNQVFTRRRGRKYVLLGDTADSENIKVPALGADFIVHEATIKHRPELVGSPIATHSSVQMAARFAASVQAKTLFLTHFGREIDPRQEVESAAPNHSFAGRIEIAEELKTYDIPKREEFLPPIDLESKQ